MMITSLVVVGAASIGGLGVDRFPNIDFPVIIVTTRLQGASPEQVETEVTDPVEEAINAIAGLDELASNSYEGLSVVTARFTLETDIDVASNDVRDRVSRILTDLPAGIDPPRVERLDPDAAPVMQVAILSRRSSREIAEYGDRVLRRRIESLNGVGGVTLTGGRARQINVTVDPSALAAYGLTVRDVQGALATQNVEVPGGTVERGAEAVQLRVMGRVERVQDLEIIPLATRAGRVVRIGDVAEVTDSEERPYSLATLNGEQTVLLSIRKQSGANTVAVVDALRERIAELQTTIRPGYRLEVVRDESEFIRNSINAVQEHLIVGGFLAALVVLLFLRNGRSTVIAALAIPSSIIATFAMLKAFGLTLNTITLLALALAVGIVIDDAIVVLENIVRFIEEKGMEPRRAAVLATREIGLAVLATSFSLVAVFLPIAFMSGIVGRFMSSFGLTMSFAILVSLFVSFTLTPMLCARWLDPGPKKRDGEGDGTAAHREDDETDESLVFSDPAPESRAIERERYSAWLRHDPGTLTLRTGVYGRLENLYLRLLANAMRHRWVVGIILVLTLLATVPLMRVVPKAFLPVEDESRFEINIRAPEGTALARMHLISERIARQVRAIPGVAKTLATSGSPPGDISGRGPNQSSIYVQLVPPTEREGTQEDVIAAVRRQVLPAFEPLHLRTIVGPINAFAGGGGAAAAPVQYVISGPDIEKLASYADRIAAGVRNTPGVAEADTTLVTGTPSFEVHIDRRRAGDLGVSIADVSTALQFLVGGAPVSTFSESGEQYDVEIRARGDWRSDPELIKRVTIPTRTGGSVQLSDFATIERGTGPSFIQRLGRQRLVVVYVNTTPGASETGIIERLDQIRMRLNMESGYRAALTGRSRELGRAAKSFGFAVLLSFTFMFLVLAAQFESRLHPLTILASLPLTLPFALFSVVVLRQSLNLYSMLGILVLFGIVKKNSILQIDHMRELRRAGMSRADAVMIGNRDRLRPILMTTLAFVAGMIPLLVSTGAGSGTNRAIGSVISGGQTLALLLTLIATPVIYSWLDDLRASRAVRILGDLIKWPWLALDRLVTRPTRH